MKAGIIFLGFFLTQICWALPQVSFMVDEQYVSESEGIVTVVAQLSSPAVGVVNLPFTVSGTTNPANDHDLIDGTFVFAPGTSFSTVTFNVFSDTRNENTETIILNLQAPINAELGLITEHIVYLQDNEGIDLPSIVFTSSTQTINEGATANVLVELSETSTQIITVRYSIGGTSDGADHNLVDGVITFFPGDLSSTLSIDLYDDGLIEGNESLEIQLLSPVINAKLGPTNQHILTIEDSSSSLEIPVAFHGEWNRNNIGSGTCEEGHEADGDGLNDESQNALATFSANQMSYYWRHYMDNTTCLGSNYSEDGFVSSVFVLNATSTSFEAQITINELYRISYGSATTDLNNFNAGSGACGKNDWIAGQTYTLADIDWYTACASGGEGINSFTFDNVTIGQNILLRGSITGANTGLIESSDDGGLTWDVWMTMEN